MDRALLRSGQHQSLRVGHTDLMPLWRPLQWVHNRLWPALSWPVEPMGGGVESECLEWTVAISDLLFIGMQQNGQWSVMWGGCGNRFSIGDDLGHDGLFHNEWRIFILNIVVCVWEFLFLSIQVSKCTFNTINWLFSPLFIKLPSFHILKLLEKLCRMRLNIQTQKCMIEYHEMTHHFLKIFLPIFP